MSQPAVLDALAAHPFMSCLSAQHRVRLAAGVRPFTAAAGDLLARTGEPAHACFLVQAGYVAIELPQGARGVAPVQTVGPGEIVGWSWIVPPYRWAFDARAAGSVQGLSFDAGWLRDLCEQDHELGYRLLKQLVAVIGSRLGATRVQLQDIYK